MVVFIINNLFGQTSQDVVHLILNLAPTLTHVIIKTKTTITKLNSKH